MFLRTCGGGSNVCHSGAYMIPEGFMEMTATAELFPHSYWLPVRLLDDRK